MGNKVNPQYYKTASGNFELLCIYLLIDAYHSAISNNKCNIDWKENSFTNYLVSFIRSNPVRSENKLFVKVQVEPENNNLPIEETDDDPDRQPCIDIWYGSWGGTQNEYFIEAKNICNTNWVKSSGANVSASHLKRRYIATGIQNFVSKRYPFGCLAGYVVNDNANDCINGINRLLIMDSRKNETLETVQLINGFSNSCKSAHNTENGTVELKHIFLEFSCQ